jgi:D-alanyl-lipoteichoic acid acyltransferase DltB (MBOAT superfamily)
VAGLIFNLGLIIYYKYFGFLLSTVSYFSGAAYSFEAIILPLAISFFTFQQIAYLIDAYSGKTEEHSFLQYTLFVTFFPQLIAGPIVHHREMLSQFTSRRSFVINFEDMSVGLTLFSLGLFKKLMLADEMALYASPVFSAAGDGTVLGAQEAWVGSLAYTLQIYFDFSGYSDMAIGLARLFGIKLPLNFDSPYKSLNIIEFWRRWHMTLSRFLRDYVYIALGGNRNGSFFRYRNLLLTMLIGGVWHGAGWTFIIWGGLHGIYLMINHGWHWFRRSMGQDLTQSSLLGRVLSRLLTFLVVVLAWVFFRSDSLDTAMSMLRAMSGLNGLGIQGGDDIVLIKIAALLVFAWFVPNTQQFLAKFNPAYEKVDSYTHGFWARLVWRPNMIMAIYTGVLLLTSIIYLERTSEFIYFQF